MHYQFKQPTSLSKAVKKDSLSFFCNFHLVTFGENIQCHMFKMNRFPRRPLCINMLRSLASEHGLLAGS